ncbi:hypothetical protein [Oligosphaera ethanolica]|uniref:Uncharacterized protein n=1 Tax=Oligosphaera ethanolica TaxID=760260 RepID=A0AAE3VD01_9BACT|nr:hypothetical protein [Oligosphaera ethanolica]MDQ0288243.1 hypothetical protein [Oligosphaera ethanolica]
MVMAQDDRGGLKKHRRGRLGTAKGRHIVPLPLWLQSASPTGAKEAEEHEHSRRRTQGGARFQRGLPWAGMFRAFSACMPPGLRFAVRQTETFWDKGYPWPTDYNILAINSNREQSTAIDSNRQQSRAIDSNRQQSTAIESNRQQSRVAIANQSLRFQASPVIGQHPWSADDEINHVVLKNVLASRQVQVTLIALIFQNLP